MCEALILKMQYRFKAKSFLIKLQTSSTYNRCAQEILSLKSLHQNRIKEAELTATLLVKNACIVDS